MALKASVYIKKEYLILIYILEMLGLIQITKKKSKKLMIQRFGDKYKFVVANDPRLKVMDPTMYGIDITPNYSISLDTSINNYSSGYTNVDR